MERRTLDIYVIYYFLLAGFPQLKSFFRQDIVTKIQVSAFLAIVVVTISLLISGYQMQQCLGTLFLRSKI